MEPRVEPVGARRPARVGLDLHCFDGPHQGVRSHLLGLLPEVLAQCPEITFVVLVGDVEGLAAQDPAWSLPNVELAPMPPADSARRLLFDLPRLCDRHALDLLHVQYVAPLTGRVPTVVTLHDVLCETHPHLFPARFRWRSRLLMRRSARAARAVVTVSEYSAREIGRRYGIPAERLSVVRNAVDQTRFRPGDAGIERVRARGLEPADFLLSVGRVDRRKNLPALARAHAALGADAPPLVHAGAPGLGGGAVLRAVAPFVAAGRLRVLGDVDDDELPALLRHALLFCYPSEAEGFGMPPLEALASGTPVVCSDSTALPEVVGDAGLLVAPGDERALASVIGRLVADPQERAALAAAGLERARRFRWSESAAVLAATYRRCLSLDAAQGRPTRHAA